LLVFLPPAAAVVGGIATLGLALSHPEFEVRDSYYREGLGIYRQSLADQRASALGLAATLALAARAGAVSVDLRHPFDGDGLRLVLIHPTRAELDREIRLEALDARHFVARVATLPAARWRIELTDRQRTWRLTGVATDLTAGVRLSPMRDDIGAGRP
jgi:hypothetical protein